MDLGGFHVEPCLTSLKLFNHTNSNNMKIIVPH